MANIPFITGGELETVSHHMWTATGSGVVPSSGEPGAHGKYYDTSGSLIHAIVFDPASIVTAKMRFLFQTSVDNQAFMLLNDGVITQVFPNYRSDGSIEMKCGAVVLAQSAAGLFVVDTWYELEVRARISNGTGSIAVNRNGSQIICVPSGLDTLNSPTAQVNRWAVGNATLDMLVDDAVIDRSGAYLGTGEVETLMPSGAGDVTQLSPSSIGVANHTLVDEKPHDSDSTYVESTAADQVDTYQFENLSVSGTPVAAMLAVQARHNTGSPSLKLICRIDGENFESPSFPTASTYEHHLFHCWSVNPATGNPWSVETLNTAQWGVRCLSAGMVVTQLGLQVYVKAAESAQCLASGASRDYCQAVNEDLN